MLLFVVCSGLDNAGKTTILKKFMGEDITQISPTLGFDIQTLEYKECVTTVMACLFVCLINCLFASRANGEIFARVA